MYGNGPPVHRLANILSGLLAPEISPIQEQRIIQYSDRYRLAFTLLNENAASDRLVNSWDIQPAIVGKLSYFIWVPTVDQPACRPSISNSFPIECAP